MNWCQTLGIIVQEVRVGKRILHNGLPFYSDASGLFEKHLPRPSCHWVAGLFTEAMIRGSWSGFWADYNIA